ncbi:hypothetical protein Tdes44962_MAKER00473 [Teratosphaeria destructans]|uniref:Uncharacterized protein n=1 Tax=Teratosphaeria destructans TaxID=418781 RepID=A0A9W7W1N8_9PEZI|nr:hypothetical protein Tdes44962_MAKER00473 [Teratosphaeria destructans]
MLAISAIETVTKNMPKHATRKIQTVPAVPPFGKESTPSLRCRQMTADGLARHRQGRDRYSLPASQRWSEC